MVYVSINQLKFGKAGGTSDVMIEMLKAASDKIVPHHSNFTNLIINN